jgi:serine/threonine-protein kinase
MGEVSTLAPAAEVPSPLGVLQEGELVGGCEILRLLGSGGMAEVYEALDRALLRRVAIKVQRGKTSSPARRAGLRQEAQALAAIHHPALPVLHAIGTHRGLDYLVMEHVTGVSLAERLRTVGRLGVRETLRVLIQIADALVAVHGAGVVHRDVKPANVMLSSKDRVVLVDFGVMLPEVNLDDDVQRWALGTPEYMAPEAIRGDIARGEGYLLDLYALGMTAYELLTGASPFERESITDVVRAHLGEEVELGALERLEVPARLAQLVVALTMKDPLDRPMAAELVVAELRAIERSERYDDAASISVLIVDDDPIARDLVSSYVRRHLRGARVRVAEDGVDALDIARRTQPQLVLVDLRMPRMNGLELCLHLRSMPEMSRSTIAIVSGEDGGDERALLDRLGIQFVAKGEDLAPRIRELLRGVAERA